METSKAVSILIRVLISIVAIALLFVVVDADIAEIWLLFRDLSPTWAGVAIGLMMLQLLITAFRWYKINKAIGINVSLENCTRLMLVGQFFNQCLPTSIGGDSVKVGVLYKVQKLPFQLALLSVLLDRIAGLLVLIVIACIAWLGFISLWPVSVPQEKTISTVLSLSVVIPAFILFFAFPQLETLLRSAHRFDRLRRAAELSKKLALSFPVTFYIFGLSALVQVLISLSIFCGSLALNVSLDIHALLLLPLIMFVASLPFSFAGWGLREGAMVTGLAIVGLSPSEAISISILHGFAQILVGLPGAYIASKQIGFRVIRKLERP